MANYWANFSYKVHVSEADEKVIKGINPDDPSEPMTELLASACQEFVAAGTTEQVWVHINANPDNDEPHWWKPEDVAPLGENAPRVTTTITFDDWTWSGE
jgi:hypothetical protein